MYFAVIYLQLLAILCTCIVETNTLKIGKILKVKISLSIFESVYLTQFLQACLKF